MARVLISVISKKVLSIFNSIWSDIDNFNYVPEKIHFLTAEKDYIPHMVLKEMLTILLEEYKVKNPVIEFHDFEENNYVQVSETIQRLVQQEQEKNNTFALETTPGKKGDVIPGIMIALHHPSCEHVFYTDLKSFDNVEKSPYYLIPSHLFQTFDMKKEVVVE